MKNKSIQKAISEIKDIQLTLSEREAMRLRLEEGMKDTEAEAADPRPRVS